MKNISRLIGISAAILFVLALMQVMLETSAESRAGRGGSGGFRGSRTYKAPARPANPGQPARDATPTPQQPAPLGPQPGGFMRGLGTAVLGGFLGSMLFSGLANAGWGGFGGSGFGMIEILLFAGLAYFIIQRFRRRPAAATGYDTMQYQSNQEHGYSPAAARAPEAQTASDIDYRTLTLMDRNFDPNQFLKQAQAIFFKVQGAWNKQDTAALGALCGPELMQSWQSELMQLRARGERNRLENIALRESEITEAWTESGQDFITVRFKANLLDYTINERNGSVTSGSDSEPIEFEEYWTFTRPVGPNAWKLTAVQQA